MMNFFYIANVRLPTEKAHGFQIVKMTEAFAENGVKPTLIVPRRFNRLGADPFDYYGLPSVNFRIVRLPCLDLLPIFGGAFGFFVQSLTFFLAARIYLLFRRVGVIYSRDLAAGLFFKNLFLEVHNLPAKPNFWHRVAWQNAKKLFAVTGFIREDLQKFGVSPEKIVITPDGVDLGDFSNQLTPEESVRRLNLKSGLPIALYAGSFYLYSWKGVDVLLQAAEQLIGRARVVLVGGSAEEIRALKERSLPANVTLISHRRHKEIPLFLMAANLLVLPNTADSIHSERYTSPLKLFEYLAAGRPIVASRLPSIAEILNDSNSILVNPGDQGDLAAGIIKILDDPALAFQLAGKAKKDAERYSWRNRATVILKAIFGG
jgi:glycosyltransferase involved in cell wall biosynthesis